MGTGKLKLYLTHILVTTKQKEASDNGESGLIQFHQQFRSLVDKVLCQKEGLSSPGPYIPLFYQIDLTDTNKFVKVSPSETMQQPLCHLYFMTVMEHLNSVYQTKSQTNMLSSVVKKASHMHKQLKDAEKENAILWIEYEAIVQILIQQLAIHLNPSQPELFRDVQHLLQEINMLVKLLYIGIIKIFNFL